MLPTNNTIQTPTTQTSTITSTSNAVSSIGIVNAHSCIEQIETVDIVTTYTVRYASDIFPHPDQPCHYPIAVFDGRIKPTLHCCEVIANTHHHLTRMTKRIPIAENPIPTQAVQQMELLDYERPAVDDQGKLAGFIVTQTSSTWYENNAPAHAPREVEVGLHSFQEICTLQDGYHIHSVTRPVFISLEQTPIPPKAFSFCWHLAYDPTNVEYTAPELSNDESHTASYPANLPHHWKDMNKGDRKYYIDDIVQCFDAGATCSMIAKRHSITNKNVQQILVEEAQKTLRTIKEEREIALTYRSDRGKTLKLPELTRPPLREYLEENFTPHQARLNPYEQKKQCHESKNFSYRIVQKKLNKNATEYAPWCFPRNWELVSDTNKERYVNDICECYEKKATYHMIAKRHNIRVLAVRGILLLRYQNIRTPDDEKVLTLNYTDVKTGSSLGASILKDLPRNLPPLQHHLAQLAEQKKTFRTDKTRQPAFTKLKQQTAQALVGQDSSSPVFARSSRTTTAPQETTSEEDTP